MVAERLDHWRRNGLFPAYSSWRYVDASKELQVSADIDDCKFATFNFFSHLTCGAWLALYHITNEIQLWGRSLGAMLRGSTLGEADQIIGEAAVCSGWTRMEGQGSWNVQQFLFKIQTCIFVCFTMLCKIQRFILGTGPWQLFYIHISTFQNRVWEIYHKSMVVYLISNITVDVSIFTVNHCLSTNLEPRWGLWWPFVWCPLLQPFWLRFW